MKLLSLRHLFSLYASLLLLTTLVIGQTPPSNPPTQPGSSGRSSGPATHTIRGKLFLPSGNLPDQRIRVVLELSSGGIAGETFSDSVGNFEFRNLPSNSYRITVPSDRRLYETTQEMVEVFGNISRTFMVHIYLKDINSGIEIKPKNKMISVAELQEVPKAAKKHYEKGLKLAKEGKSQEAIALFQEAVKLFPDYLLALNKLGEQYMALNQLAEAEAALGRAIAVDSKFSVARINLGILLVNLKRFDEAIEHLEAANRLDETYPMAHLFLGLALMEKQPVDFDRAEREMNRALELGGQALAYVRLHLFNLNIRRQSYDKAAWQLETYLKEVPNAPNADSVRATLEKVKKLMAQNPEQVKKP